MGFAKNLESFPQVENFFRKIIALTIRGKKRKIISAINR